MRKEMLIMFLLAVLSLVVNGCSMGQPSQDTLDKMSSVYLESREFPEQQMLTQSLFPSDQAVLGSESVERILDSKISIPSNARLAVIRFRQRPYTLWSEEFTQLDQGSQESFIQRLQTSRRLSKVSVLPSLMVPQKKTIPHLREAAARYQADLLLVYRPVSRFYAKYRIFNPQQVKAECMVETILLDVRTGIVPFAAVSSQQYTAEKTKEDYNFQETYDKAEIKAASAALNEIAAQLVAWLDTDNP